MSDIIVNEAWDVPISYEGNYFLAKPQVLFMDQMPYTNLAFYDPRVLAIAKSK
jgi:hypothetical protein